MDNPSILFSVQDDINNRRVARKRYRESRRLQIVADIDGKPVAEVESKDDEGKESTSTAGTSGNIRAAGEQDISLREAREMVEVALVKGPREVIRLMNSNQRNANVQERCCLALGNMAAFSMRNRYKRYKGIYAASSDSMLAPHGASNLVIGKLGGINAIIQALVKHRTKRSVVLRGLWAMSHIVRHEDNWRKFLMLGGHTTLDALEPIFETDKDIILAIRVLLKKPDFRLNRRCCLIS